MKTPRKPARRPADATTCQRDGDENAPRKEPTMKKAICILTLASILAACGESRVINGKEYDMCGVVTMFTDDDCKDPAVKYKPSWGNIVWGVILVETVIAPIYFFGFSMFNPLPK